ncbi:MAG: RNA polymerase sigma factor, partial [Bacteroidia bacterium]
MDKNNEQELIQACVKGDEKAQQFLYEKYSRIMFGTCLRYSNTYEDAKDILQDGFIKVYTRISQFNYSGVFEGWMKRIFINTALEHYRINKVYHDQSDVDFVKEGVHNDFTIEKISQKEILELLNSMAPGYRAVLNLFIIEGYN